MKSKTMAVVALASLLAVLVGVSAAVAAPGLQPAVPHPTEAGQDCLACHKVGGSGVGAPNGTGMPDDHRGRPSSICLGCHDAPKLRAKPTATAAAPGSPPATAQPVPAAVDPSPPTPAAAPTSTPAPTAEAKDGLPAPLVSGSSVPALPSAGEEEDAAALGIVIIVAGFGLASIALALRRTGAN